MRNYIFLGGKIFVIEIYVLLLSVSLFASVLGDEHWGNQFGPVGASDPLNSVVAVGGKVYIGGRQTAVGNTKANSIASYDGTNWSALNNGVVGDLNSTYVFSLAANSTDIYAGGWFTNADGSGAKYLARWDGENWWPMGGSPANNPNSIVEVVKFIGTNLYVGGLFTTNGGVVVNRIAVWNGSSWSALGTGVSGGNISGVTTIESDGTNIYVGGLFTQAGSANATNIARWDGNNWSALGTAISGPVSALAHFGGYLYAGGSFTNTSLGCTNLARWDGNAWSAVSANRIVRALVTDGTNIYAGGDFTVIGGVAANRIAKWDGNVWSPVGAGIQGFGVGTSPGVDGITLDGNGWLYVVGNFNQVGGVGVSHVAGWNGTNWFALGGVASKGMTHFNGDVQSLLADGVNLYAGGIFTEAGDAIVNGIARWDGSNWNAVGNAAPGMLPSSTSTQVKAIAEGNGYLYAGGSFTNIGGVSAAAVAQWDGANWSPMASGLNGTVYALAVYQGVLFAGGKFTGTADGNVSLHGIAQWTGTDWADVPEIDAWRINNIINVLVTDGNNLYVGGNFYVGWGFGPSNPTVGADVFNLGYWDGSNWWPMGDSPSNTVSALAVTNGLVYAGGAFTGIGDVSANRIAAWDGSGWSALGRGLNPGSSSGSATGIAIIGGNVYVTGSFTNAGGNSVNSVAKWDGANWSALGSGLYNSVFAGPGTGHSLTAIGNDLYVGGQITSAGDKPSMFIAHWNDQSDFYPTPNLHLARTTRSANSQFGFRVAGTSGESYIIQASTDLSNWIPLQTNSATLYDFLDTNAPAYPQRFYRAVFGP